jgi:hypothetical protein
MTPLTPIPTQYRPVLSCHEPLIIAAGADICWSAAVHLRIQLALSLPEDPDTGASINHIEVDVFALAAARVALRERLPVDHALGGR